MKTIAENYPNLEKETNIRSKKHNSAKEDKHSELQTKIHSD